MDIVVKIVEKRGNMLAKSHFSIFRNVFSKYHRIQIRQHAFLSGKTSLEYHLSKTAVLFRLSGVDLIRLHFSLVTSWR